LSPVPLLTYKVNSGKTNNKQLQSARGRDNPNLDYFAKVLIWQVKSKQSVKALQYRSVMMVYIFKQPICFQNLIRVGEN
jgi:hypothetical protein